MNNDPSDSSDQSSIINTCAKCLAEYNELQEMLKEKEMLQYNKVLQQKLNSKLSGGFKVRVSNSQIFDRSITENDLKEDTDDLKDELMGVDEFSSPRSSDRRDSHFTSPDKNDLLLINDDGMKNFKLSEIPNDKGKLEERKIPQFQSIDNMKTDEMHTDQMEELVMAGSLSNEASLSLLKCRSEKKENKSIREEVEEYIFNTHIDEYRRFEEVHTWTEKKKNFYEALDRLVDYHVGDIVDHIFNEKELQEIFQNDEKDDSEQVWKKRFLEYTTKAIRLVKPSQRLMNDSMDINDYVEIELIENEDESK